MYLNLLTDDSTEQFLNSEHPITFTSNTGRSLGLDSHDMEIIDIQKKVRKFYNKHNPTTLLIEIPSILPAPCNILSHIDIIYRNLFKLHL